MKEEVVISLVVTLFVVVISLWIGCLVAQRQGNDHLKKVLDTILCIVCSFGFGFLLTIFSMGNLFIC